MGNPYGFVTELHSISFPKKLFSRSEAMKWICENKRVCKKKYLRRKPKTNGILISSVNFWNYRLNTKKYQKYRKKKVKDLLLTFGLVRRKRRRTKNKKNKISKTRKKTREKNHMNFSSKH